MSRFIKLFSVSCILACCLPRQLFASPVLPISSNNGTRNRTIPLSTGDHEHQRQHRKPISIANPLIVHLISSQPNPSSSHHKSQFDSSLTHSLHSSNSTDNYPNPALSCTDGQTYWNSIVGQCVDCTSACPAGAYVSRVCNRTHDLECQCHKGSYMSVVDKTCKPCAECPFGWGKCFIGIKSHSGHSQFCTVSPRLRFTHMAATLNTHTKNFFIIALLA